MLYYFDDLKSEEIARAIGVSHSTVRNRLLRARQQLRGLLDEYAADAASVGEVKQYAI